MIREVRQVGTSEGQGGGEYARPERERRKAGPDSARHDPEGGGPATVVQLSEYVRTVRARRHDEDGASAPPGAPSGGLLDLAEQTARAIRRAPEVATGAQATMVPGRVQELTGGMH